MIRFGMRRFTRADAGRRIDRFYVVDVQRDLFDRATVWLEWGRRGQPGRLRRKVYADPADADREAARVIRRRLQRGYRETALRRS